MHGLVWRSPKSAAEVTIVMSLFWDFQKGIICRGLFEFSLSLALDLRINPNPLKLSQILGGGGTY